MTQNRSSNWLFHAYMILFLAYMILPLIVMGGAAFNDSRFPSVYPWIGLTDGGFARVSTAHGSCVLKVSISANQQPGSIFAPIHWSEQTASCARIGELVAPETRMSTNLFSA